MWWEKHGKAQFRKSAENATKHFMHHAPKQVPSQHRIPLHLIQSRLQRATSRRSASHLEDPVAQGTAGITSPSDQPFLDTLLMEVMTTGQAHHSSCVLRCVLRCVCVVAAHLLMTNGTGFHVTGRDFFQKCVHGIGLQLQRACCSEDRELLRVGLRGDEEIHGLRSAELVQHLLRLRVAVDFHQAMSLFNATMRMVAVPSFHRFGLLNAHDHQTLDGLMSTEHQAVGTLTFQVHSVHGLRKHFGT